MFDALNCIIPSNGTTWFPRRPKFANGWGQANKEIYIANETYVEFRLTDDNAVAQLLLSRSSLLSYSVSTTAENIAALCNI